ncbi:TOMM precursor leader peptide-binding protein [Cellulomonas cellasea]|uniref:TOMM precursor leader peptide-binding protein n=1 Tax=Cellulomonas cellasea TaxID=43670 RepID=UPI0025A3A680|nr:TOMM precursor leader peptide-binding protein [Cellulomonas cellasea]MDM8084782.1 TOMM precursor leader peptide-binding protein [Cellulomonas cellasea]
MPPRTGKPDAAPQEWARPGSVRLVREGRHEAVASPTERALLAALDPRGGRRALVDVLAQAVVAPGVQATAAQWWSALRSLAVRGVVALDEPTSPGADVDSGSGSGSVSFAPAEVVVAGDTRGSTGDGVRAALRAAGLLSPQPANGSPVRVVLTSDLACGAARDAYDAALAAGARVLPVGLGQHTLRIGPLLHVDLGCPACLARSLHPGAAQDPPHDAPLGWSSAVEHAAGGLVAARVAGLLDVAGAPADPAHGAITAPAWELTVVDVRALAVTRHPLTWFPTCTRCGGPSEQTRVAPVLSALPPTPVDPAHGYRSTSAAAFNALCASQVDPLTGVVTALQDAEQMAGGHVVRARHRVRTADGWTTLTALGRGADALQAGAAALGEAIERCSMSWHGDEPLRRGTLRELGEDGLDPAEWLLFADGQADHHGAVPRRLGPDEEVDLAPLRSLATGRVRWAPASALLFGHPGPGDIGAPDSNGCAAAATWPEAVLHGLLELVERDAVSLWWYPRSRRPALDPAVLDPALRAETDARLRAAGREWWLLDLAHDLGVPVVAAVSRRAASAHEAIVFGFGAGLDQAGAARRALGELDQMLLLGPDTDAPGAPPEAHAFWAEARLDTHAYLRPHADAQPCPVQVSPSADAAADVRALVALLGAHHIEVLVHDATRPETGIPVARVVAPGLRHLDRRLAPGRLHDVPARLGWAPPGPLDPNPVWLFV